MPPEVYAITYRPGRLWHVDGPHGDEDLAAVYRDMKMPQPLVLELTVPAEGAPTVENVTAKATNLAAKGAT